MAVAVAGGRLVGVRGRAADRVNHGRLGPKGLFGWQANHSPDRLTRPLIRMDGRLRETDWDTAMTRVVERSRDVIDEHGRLAMADTMISKVGAGPCRCLATCVLPLVGMQWAGPCYGSVIWGKLVM